MCSSTVLILQALSRNSTLKVIDLQKNHLTAEAGEHLVSVVLHNIGLDKLYFSEGTFEYSTYSSGAEIESDYNNVKVSVFKLYHMLELYFSSIENKSSIKIKIGVGFFSNSIEKLWLHGINQHSSVFILNCLKTITTLKMLHLNHNQINQEASGTIATVIMHNAGLEELCLNNNDLDKGMLEVSKALQHITSLKSIDLGNSNISKEASVELASAIKVNKDLEKLELCNTNLKSSAVVILQALSTISTIKSLNISDNQITEEADEALASVILHNTNLEELYLGGNNLNNVFRVINALQHIQSLRSINLGNCNISKEALGEVATAINCNKQLEKLWLYNNHDIQSSAISILQSLSTITTLKSLYMNNNQISEKGGDALASVIKSNTGLKELHFGSNNLQNSAVKILKALQKNSAIESLDLSNNSLLDVNTVELAAAIQSNNCLKQLWLHSNNLQSSIVVILQALSELSTLELLDLHNCHLTSIAAKGLESVIVNNTGLKYLYLNDNHLGKDLIIILKALQNNSSLKEFNIGNNNFMNDVVSNLSVANAVQIYLENLCQYTDHSDSSGILLLKQLCVASKSITKITIVKQAERTLAFVLQNNPRLEVFYVDHGCLSAAPNQVIKALKCVNSIKVLSLTNLDMSIEMVKELASAIKLCTCLETVCLHSNNLKLSAIILLKELSTISTLKMLDLQNNELTEEAGEPLASVIANNSSLEILFLGNNTIGIGILKIAIALCNIKSIKMLGLNNNNLSTEISCELAAAIKSNCCLELLTLSSNCLQSSAIDILHSLSTITTLKVLKMDDNQIDEKGGDALASVIKSNTKLIELHFGSNNLQNSAVKILKALQKNSAIQSLDLSDNSLLDVNTVELAAAIQSNNSLKQLWLHSNNLQSSIVVILQALSELSTLELLDLHNCHLTSISAKELESVIVNNTGLKYLYLNDNNLGKGLITILKALQNISSLKEFNISNNNFMNDVVSDLSVANAVRIYLENLCKYTDHSDSSGILFLKQLCIASKSITKITIVEQAEIALALVLQNNPRLEIFYVDHGCLSAAPNQVIKALKYVNSIKVLSLTNLDMSIDTVKELASAIKLCTCLETVYLYSNSLKLSAIILLKELSTISTLRRLDLTNNELTEEVGEPLASVIMNNPSLETLFLDENNIGVGALKIAKALSNIKSLKMLGLDNNNLPKEIAYEFAAVIKSNCYLELLKLNSNNLQSSATVILQSLSTITTLKYLVMDNNQIGEKGGEVLTSVITSNKKIKAIFLRNNNLQKSVIKISQALQSISTLEMLSLGNNNLPGGAGIELAANFQSHHSVSVQSSLSVILNALNYTFKLRYLSIFDNTITEDAGNALATVISRNIKLQTLSLNQLIDPLKVTEALQNLSALQTLVFDTCNISEEAEVNLASTITNNKSLTFLSLENIKLSQNIILQSIATVSNLRYLWLGDSSLSDEMSDDLSLAIRSNRSLEELILLDNMLQTGLIKIAKACNKLSNIKVLQLAHNCIVPSKVVELTSVITQNTSLEGVLLGGITLNAAECFHLNINEVLHKTNMLSNNTSCVIPLNHCPSLEIIYLEMLRKKIVNTKKCSNNTSIYVNAKNFVFVQKLQHYFNQSDITQLNTHDAKQKLLQVDAKEMISSLYILEKVKVIDLENNNIDEDASFELATALHSNNVLEQLWLRGNKLNTVGALYILNSLEYLTTLQVLDLSYNNISSQSADGITAVIDNNPLLNQLWLDGNDLHSTGTIKICKALKKIRTLSILSLCNNGITDDVADELSAVITQNVLLEDLLLSNNQLHSTGIELIAESLNKLTKLRKLDLFNNDIGKEGASLLAVVIQNSPSLQDLFLSSNNLGTSGALEICSALSHICSLHVLTLSNNNINGEVTSQVIEVLNNNHLYALLIGGNGLECGSLKIAQVIENDNIAMQLFDLSDNNISEQDKEKIKVVFLKRANFQLYV